MPVHADDLIVYVNPDPNDPTNPNGGVYSLPAEVYAKAEFKMDPVDAAGPLSLLSFGTVVANIPSDLIGLGGMCYLINLPALQPPRVNPGQVAVPPPRPKLSGSQMLTALNGMLKHTEGLAGVPGTKDLEITTALRSVAKQFE